MSASDQPPPLIAIVGETATGKSALALEIAKRFDGEIVNADSWQIYKGMDVGTAKPDQQERSEVKHHLIDVVNPDEDFNAAMYKKLAAKAIDDIASRGKLPILVGGTGLYVDSVLFDYSFAPIGSRKKREELNQKTIPELLDIIKQQDLDLVGIDTRNKRRLVRLIESGGERPEAKEIRDNTLVIGTRTSSRAKLRDNIERRVEVMFKKGLRKEVAELVEKYDFSTEAMKGIGYREFEAHYKQGQSISEVKRRIVKSTLELAKRQRTWFKRNQQIVWVESVDEGVKIASKFLQAKLT